MTPDYIRVQDAASGTGSPRHPSHISRGIDSQPEGMVSPENEFSPTRVLWGRSAAFLANPSDLPRRRNTALNGRDPIDYKRHTHRSADSHKPQSPIEAQPIVQHPLRRQPRVAAGYNHCKALQPSACIPIASTLNLQSAATGVRSFATASLLFDGLLSLQSLLFQTSPE